MFFEARNLKNQCFSRGKSLFFRNPRFQQELARGLQIIAKMIGFGEGFGRDFGRRYTFWRLLGEFLESFLLHFLSHYKKIHP